MNEVDPRVMLNMDYTSSRHPDCCVDRVQCLKGLIFLKDSILSAVGESSIIVLLLLNMKGFILTAMCSDKVTQKSFIFSGN